MPSLSPDAIYAALERIANLLLRVSEDTRAQIAEQNAKRQQDERIVRAVEDNISKMDQVSRHNERILRGVEAQARSTSSIEAELASYLPRQLVVINEASEKVDAANAKAEDAAAKSAQALAQIEQMRKDAEEQAKQRKQRDDATDQYIRGAADPKGPWAHLVDRLDKVRPLTWLFLILFLLTMAVSAFSLYLAEVGFQKKETPHVLPAHTATTGTGAGESDAHRNTR